LAAAAVARHHGDELAEYALLHPAHLASPLARGALLRLGARFGPASLAARARRQARYVHLFLRTEDRLLEFDRQPVSQVSSALRAPARARAHPCARGRHESLEDIRETAEAREGVKARAAVAGDRRVPEAVVRGALVLIDKHLVRFAHLFELRLGVRG